MVATQCNLCCTIYGYPTVTHPISVAVFASHRWTWQFTISVARHADPLDQH